MAIKDALLPEWDHEMASTRKVLAAMADHRLDFTPHAKSWPMVKLATHVVTMGLWAHMTCTLDALDLAGSPPAPKPGSVAEVLAIFDEWAAKGRAAIEATDDAAMMAPWALKNGDHVIFSMPRVTVLRSFVFNHLIHHRGQLTMYLRLTDAKVPGMYGPSADESGM